MARVTVEDCIEKVPNRFDLVMLAAQRARQISSGSSLTVDRDNDKNPVVALREIAEASVSIGELEESFIQSLQKFVPGDEPEDEELMEFLSEEQTLSGQHFEKELEKLAVEAELSDDSSSEEEATSEDEEE